MVFVRVKKLKCLVVSFDHGFYRPTLIDNRSRTLKLLGQDFIQFTPNWKLVRKLMYESLVRRGDFCWRTRGFFFSDAHCSEVQRSAHFWGEPTGEYASFYSYDEKEEVNEERFNRFTIWASPPKI